MKMIALTDEVLEEHYAHLKENRFSTNQRVNNEPGNCCGIERHRCGAIVRKMTGVTNGREAQPGTIEVITA